MNHDIFQAQLRTRHEILYFIFAAMLPIIFTAGWLWTNTQLPGSDATDYIVTGHKIYLHFTENGFWHGLLHFEIARGWRPIFFSVLNVPFLFLSHGNVNFAFQALTLTCIFVSAIYVYLLSRLVLDRFSAIIAANLICLLPFVLAPGFLFLAEIALFPLIMGALYHLIQSNFFRMKKHVIGFIICFSLAIVVRPVEAITEFFFIIIAFLFVGWHQKIFSLKQIVWVLALGLSTLFILLFAAGVHFIHHYPFHPIDGGIYDIKLARSIYHTLSISLCCFLFAWVGLALISSPNMQKRLMRAGEQTNQSPIIFVFAAIFILVMMWFLSSAFEVYVWIYRTSVGDLAQNTINYAANQSMFKVLYNYAVEEGILSILVAGLAALSATFCISKQKLREVCFSYPVIYLLFLVPFPILEVINTVQTGPRKLILAVPGLILTFLLLGLQQGKYWKLRLTMIIGLLSMQFVFAMSMFNFTFTLPLQNYKAWFGVYPKPVILHPNPHDEVLRFLTAQAELYQLKHIAIIVQLETVLPVDPFILSMLYQINNLPFSMGLPGFSTYAESNIRDILKSHDAVFLSHMKNKMLVSKEAANAYYEQFENVTNPNFKNLYRFLYYYSQNNLNEIGLKVGPCITIKAIDDNDYLGCLLLPSHKSETA